MTNPTDIIQAAQKEGRKVLFEHEARELARSAGITVPKYVLTGTDPQAVADAGESLGFPVVLKAVSPDILHKTDAGAVMLNITSRSMLAASVTAMKNMMAARAPGAVVNAFLIEKMMPQGIELLVGGLRDEQFGPSVAFGLGGVWVEALKDAVFGILPMSHEETVDMISQTRAGMFLRGFRGSPALDEEAVHLIIANLSKLLTDHSEIREIDMNPVRVYARGAIALDVKIVLNNPSPS